jgi:hypothetical protein
MPPHQTPIVFDSVTHVGADQRGKAALCASHGGTYAGYYAAKMGLGAVILNDAGIGRERAGIGGVLMLGKLGVPAAAISHRTGRIGDGEHCAAHGRISFANAEAARLGVAAGMAARDALALLSVAKLSPAPAPPAEDEHRFVEPSASRNGVNVIVADSISLVRPEDAGHILVAASHGGLLGGKPETAVKYPVFAAITNDADRGIDDAGISRLSALEARGIAGACVSAFSSRIGDGRSQWETGCISVVNETAVRYGGIVGQSCKEFAAAMVAARIREG